MESFAITREIDTHEDCAGSGSAGEVVWLPGGVMEQREEKQEVA